MTIELSTISRIAFAQAIVASTKPTSRWNDIKAGANVVLRRSSSRSKATRSPWVNARPRLRRIRRGARLYWRGRLRPGRRHLARGWPGAVVHPVIAGLNGTTGGWVQYARPWGPAYMPPTERLTSLPISPDASDGTSISTWSRGALR